MDDEQLKAIIRMAVDPRTPEGEAVAALLALRRKQAAIEPLIYPNYLYWVLDNCDRLSDELEDQIRLALMRRYGMD